MRSVWRVRLGIKERSTCKHGNTCPPANAALVHPFQGCKAIVGVDTSLSSLVELISEDIQHQFAITLGVDVSMSLLVQMFAQFRRVDEVAIVAHGDAIGAVDVERLCLRVCATASSWVSKMAETHEAGEVCHACAILENSGSHPIAFALVEATARVTAYDARRILSAVLQEVEGLVYFAGGVYRFPSRLSRVHVKSFVVSYGSAWITAMIPHMATDQRLCVVCLSET